MDAKKIALLVGALIIAAVTAFAARSMFAGQAAPQAAAAAPAPKIDGPEVLVATRALPPGTIITPDSFRFQPWPKELIETAYYIKGDADPASLAGTVVRFNVTAGQPVTKGALVAPGDRGFLAAALGPGMRAVTVEASASSGVAGFVFPGDRVDLVITQTIEAKDEGQPLRVSETFVRNVRVLATDQRTVVEDAEGKREVKEFDTVTLEATPRIAEKIAVAEAVGAISLSLRSLADNAAELERAVAAGEVRLPEGKDAKAARQLGVQVASRPIDSDPTFVTGADVSRFQRRTLPAAAPKGGSGTVSMSGEGAGVSAGPVVRVARGNIVTDVSVGGK